MKKERWLLSPIKYSYKEEKTLWQKARGYVFAFLIATVIVLAFFLSMARAELVASWYSRESLVKEGTWRHGEKLMANGQHFRDKLMVCASRLYPLGSRLRITSLKSGREVVVVVADRISKRYGQSRLDLSKEAFAKIGDLKDGVIPIKIQKLGGVS